MNGLGSYGFVTAMLFLIAVGAGTFAGGKIGEWLSDAYSAARQSSVTADRETAEAREDWALFVQTLDAAISRQVALQDEPAP
jgi:hypothetical protein